MVQTHSSPSTIPLPFPLLCPAYFLRYPNPFAQHVISVDVLDRLIIQRDPTQPPTLLTSRLLLKKGTLPRWAPRGLIKSAESWVLEVSEVELEGFQRGEGSASASGTTTGAVERGRQMRTWTHNLDHTTVLAVAEGLTFTEQLASSPPRPPARKGSDVTSDVKGKGRAVDEETQTHCLTTAHITSDVSVIWKRIEKFGLKRFMAHMDTSRQGLLYAASHLSSPSSSSSTTTSPPHPTTPYKLRESLRPPWLDGLPLSPMAKLRQFADRTAQRYRTVKEEGLWGYTGRREREDGMKRWRDELRERLVRLREWRRPTLPTAGAGAQQEQIVRDRGENDKRTDARSPSGSSTPVETEVEPREEESIEVHRERLARMLHERATGG
ncbi:hypothetical protein BDZ90DRAFT_277561 [Jaminaea rosea]|uniref:PRELI/MSF1 domain-containing protein n=1 Tax=Jaminaea rosea TaxID=1569628 RepID=A0A316V0U5_9BASI|nr:hypothetical protein BDZ90DRAFT_277561 [Jaminaea rosea]PWN31166.1 hypothetical protein BDZ90DRAFT_277561 [Jaminaea rosea]